MAHALHGFNPALNKTRKHTPALSSRALKQRAVADLLPAGERRSSYERAFGHAVAQIEYARETERQKIAGELHDQIGQDLVLAAMKLGALKGSVSAKKMPLVAEIQNLIKQAIDETRSLACELYPQALHDLGLAGAVEWLVEKTGVKFGLACSCEVAWAPPELSQEIEATIFQAIRELLVNVAKHARATEARVSVRGQDRWLLVEIVDDGQGFDPGRVCARDPRRGGFGLISIRERLSNFGGRLSIDSAPGQGTRITLTVPVMTVGREAYAPSCSRQ
jgi:signal transduction histidine kinase